MGDIAMTPTSRGPRGTRFAAGWAASLCAVCCSLIGPAFAAEPTPGRALTINPSVGLQGTATDNGGATAEGEQSDFITRALLGLDLRLDTVRSTAMLLGEVSYDAYARMSELSGWSVSGSGSGAYQVIPGLLALEGRGTITNGNVSTFGSSATDRAGPQGRVQLATYDVGPQLTMKAGEVADVAVAARFAQVFYSTQDRNSELLLPRDANIIQVIGRATTGERLRGYELLSTGEAVKDNHGYRSANAVQSVYVDIAPRVRLIARAGYERVSQPGITKIEAPVLSAGLEFSPNTRSKISVEGGRRYDRTAWSADANVQLSQRFFLTGSYAQTVQPDQVFVARSFREFVTRTAQLPAPIAPGSFTFTGNLYNETSLYKSAELRAVYTDMVNTATASATWSDRKFLRAGGHDRTLVSDVTLARRIRTNLTATVQGSYARTYESPLYGASDAIGLSARVLHRLSRLTDINVSYDRVQSRQRMAGGLKIVENALSFAIRKAF
jgi:uncharacterized protein (PEP-CTERM system associated)